MDTSYDVKKCSTAIEFVEYLRRTNPRWLPSQKYDSPWIFRGQASANPKWNLIPAAWRNQATTHPGYFNSIDRAFTTALAERLMQHESIRTTCKGDENVLKSLIYQETFERKIVRNFVTVADDIGFRLPGPAYPEADNCNPFKECSGFPEEYHPAIALAQHHGFPTRLLDWTKNPLIAASFAAEEIDDKESEYIAVFAINRECLFKKTNYREFNVPRSEIGYLHAQEALFTYRKGANEYFAEHGSWPSLDQELQREDIEQVLCPKNEIRELRRLLWAERLSKAHLMPTLDNVGKTQSMIWDDIRRANPIKNDGEDFEETVAAYKLIFDTGMDVKNKS